MNRVKFALTAHANQIRAADRTQFAPTIVFLEIYEFLDGSIFFGPFFSDQVV